MRRNWLIAVWFGLISLLPLFRASSVIAETSNEQLLIYEVKLGGGEEPKEYLSLYNASASEVDLSGWRLEYAKASFDSQYCEAYSWTDYSLNGSASLINLTGSLLPGQVSQPLERSLTDDAAGAIRLVRDDGDTAIIHDLVGWGELAPCYENQAAAQPSTGKSIKRWLDCQSQEPLDTNNNESDFAGGQTPTPGLMAEIYFPPCYDESADASQCHLIMISEVLPNPSGLDGPNEFIEIYNPTSTSIPLAGCNLMTSANNHSYELGTLLIEPEQYLAFYSNLTGLTLTNASGGTVSLNGSGGEAVIDYPANLADDRAWALVDGSWQITNVPTPGQPNRSSITVIDVQAAASELSACPAGKYRNPETNRCKNLELTDLLTACGPGQTRNPQTNRCRNVLASTASLVACKPGQARNPATNRCKSVTSSKAGLVACRPGQSRNPQTNRCRKDNSLAASPSVGAAPKSSLSSKLSPWALTAISASIVGYGIYEYRHGLANFIHRLKSKFKSVA